MRRRIGRGSLTRAKSAKHATVRITSACPLVLGSASPRRRDLLAATGVPFVVHAAEADESLRDGEAPAAYLERVTLAKLRAVRALALGPCAGVLVADTIVVAPDGAILGKPRDPTDALSMFERLVGAVHAVETRFVLAPPEAGAPPAHAETVSTRVEFRAASRDEMRAYVATGEGTDKAGGYAAQGRAAAFVRRIDGSYTNVVGLPVCEVTVALRALGWTAPTVPGPADDE
jgi:septum formation protein